MKNTNKKHVKQIENKKKKNKAFKNQKQKTVFFTSSFTSPSNSL